LAYREQYLKVNVSDFLDYIPRDEAHVREYLTIEEVKILYETPCVYDVLKNAAMFSILTGLRFSDIYDLDWSHIITASDGKPCIVKQIVKTRRNARIYISEEALEFCGTPKASGKVFPYLRKSMTCAPLQKWIKRSGINKHITFHCFRHTNATLLASNGIDIYTVKEQLVHTHVTTTEIYAKLIDTKKRSASEVITLK
jgi:integrase